MNRIIQLVKARVQEREITPLMKQLAVQAASPNEAESYEAFKHIARALSLPLRRAILHGDMVANIFERKTAQPGQFYVYPKSAFNPENDGNFESFVMPQFGAVPDRQIVGDYVMVPVFRTSNGLSASVSYVEKADWDVMEALAAQLVNGHIRTRNRLGFETLLAAAAARNFTVTDSEAATGLFTKRLLSFSSIKMRRLGGGNATSPMRRRLTDVYYSLEGQADLRNWDLTQIDEISRREIFIADDDSETLNKVFGIRLHPMDEFGVGQKYQSYITRATVHGGLAKTQPSGTEEFCLGLDLANRDSFIMPVSKDVQIFPDITMRRAGKFGWWSEDEYGLAALDNRNAMLMAF